MQFAKHVKIRHEKFGAVIFETFHEKIYVTNETGADILQLLEARQDPADIVAALVDEYAVEVDRLQKDVHSFIAMLRDNNIIGEGLA